MDKTATVGPVVIIGPVVINEHGVPFTVRLVREGERFGQGFQLTHDRPAPMVEFYDRRFDHYQVWEILLGQFVSRYYISDIGSCLRRGGGLCLNDGITEWSLSEANLREVGGWLLQSPELWGFMPTSEGQ